MWMWKIKCWERFKAPLLLRREKEREDEVTTVDAVYLMFKKTIKAPLLVRERRRSGRMRSC